MPALPHRHPCPNLSNYPRIVDPAALVVGDCGAHVRSSAYLLLVCFARYPAVPLQIARACKSAIELDARLVAASDESLSGVGTGGSNP